ncbi:MAG: TldD/PmbA family protein [Dehalococcoidia bacterium]|nr:TldD/PmbA family protein [Chloroflexota bacterium]MCK4243065.1 TldD/PmbA family protein [Dehalococcoidia bacterium]
MPETEQIRHLISHAFKGQHADYIEVRIEEREASRIQYRGRELEETGRSTSLGGNVRALVNGGWGFVSFNELDGLEGKVELAVNQARLVGKEASSFASVAPVVDMVEPEGVKDPTTIPLAQKKSLLDEYNEIIWSTPKIQTSVIAYGDAAKKVIFANSEGSYIEQTKMDVSLRIAVIARENGDVQQATMSLGSSGDFGFTQGLQHQVKEIAQRAVALLLAPHFKGGEYTVVLDPVLAGVFAHEAFGHLSESDFVYENERLREIMVLGRRFGGEHLNIVDGAAIPGFRGSYKYDDEGVPATKTYLIREGVLVGRLHSRETAAKMGEEPTGNARALDYRHPPIVRMTNTFIEPGKVSFDEMVADIKEGVYVKNWYGGMTSMEMFTFSAGEAYMIRDGRVAELLRPVVLTGNVFVTLGNIDAIGNDLEMNQGGGCGKGAQSPLPVSNGSPHIRISKCLVGGR